MNKVLSKPINADILKSIMLKINFSSQIESYNKRENSRVCTVSKKLTSSLNIGKELSEDLKNIY